MSGFSQRSEALSSVEVLARFQAAIVGGSSVILGSTGLPVRNAATQDAITLLGRAGGTSSYQCKLTPAALSATQTVTFPDATFTVAGLQIAQTFTLDNIFSSATASTSTTTGAVTIPNGGLGVGGAINAGSRVSAPSFLVGAGSANPGMTAESITFANNIGRKLELYGSTTIHMGLGVDVGGGPYEMTIFGAAGASNTGFINFGFVADANPGTFNGSVGKIFANGGWYIGSAPSSPGQGNLTVQNAIRSTSPTAGIGYGTGAGGTVTQATSKSTGVTLNAVCGTITMNGAALASATSVAFVFTNSAIASTDKVEVDHDSAGTLCAYNICVTPSAGSATVTVRNMTAGSLSEAIVLRFFVQKAAIA